MDGDMSGAIVPKSDQMNADDLIAGPRTITITDVKIKQGGGEQPVSIYFAGDNGKPYKACKSMCRVMVQLWGPDAKAYVGRSMTLYRDTDVTWGGLKVGGIRISHMSDIPSDATLVLTTSKTSRKPFTVKPLTKEPDATTDPAIKDAGDAAASGGVESYKAWLDGLTPAVKETVRWLHKEWSTVAKNAEGAGS